MKRMTRERLQKMALAAHPEPVKRRVRWSDDCPFGRLVNEAQRRGERLTIKNMEINYRRVPEKG